MVWLLRPSFWIGTILATACLVSSLFVIKTAYQTRQLYSALQETHAERSRLRIEWSRLLLERGALSADLRIDAMARAELQMMPPDGAQIRLVERPQ